MSCPRGRADGRGSSVEWYRGRQQSLSSHNCPSTHDSLERPQSLPTRRRRLETEGDQAFLSELAAPPPVEWQQTSHGREGVERGDSEEAGLRRASTHRNEDAAFLSEVAAPPPVQCSPHLDQSRLCASSREEVAIEEEASLPPSKGLDDSGPSSGEKSFNDAEKQLPDRGKRASSIATQAYTVSYLILFSILGTLARLGLEALTLYNGAPVTFSLLWPNFSGSLIMGFLAEDRNLFREEWGTTPPTLHSDSSAESLAAAKKAHGTVKKTIPLYVGLATGFCGSFTY